MSSNNDRQWSSRQRNSRIKTCKDNWREIDRKCLPYKILWQCTFFLVSLCIEHIGRIFFRHVFAILQIKRLHGTFAPLLELRKKTLVLSRKANSFLPLHFTFKRTRITWLLHRLSTPGPHRQWVYAQDVPTSFANEPRHNSSTVSAPITTSNSFILSIHIEIDQWSFTISLRRISFFFSEIMTIHVLRNSRAVISWISRSL